MKTIWNAKPTKGRENRERRPKLLKSAVTANQHGCPEWWRYLREAVITAQQGAGSCCREAAKIAYERPAFATEAARIAYERRLSMQ